MTQELFILAFLLFIVIATLYSSVGHAGASGYLAIMVLLSFAPETIKPTSLILNIVVSFIASVKFIRAGYFDRKIFLSFVITSIPFAFVGGYIKIDPHWFKLFAGLFLLFSALFLSIKTYIETTQGDSKALPVYAGPVLGPVLGSVIGLVSGLVGVGGGIFLSPILIIANWTSAKKASGIAALFIFVNSVSGLAGHFTAFNTVNLDIFYWIIAVIIGGLLGSTLGTSKFSNKIIMSCLFVVLLSAGLKFIFIDFMN